MSAIATGHISTKERQAIAAIMADRAARDARLCAVRSRLAAAHGGLVLAVDGGEYQLHGRDPTSGEDGRLCRYDPHADPGLVALHASAFEDLLFLVELFETACARIRDLVDELHEFRQSSSERAASGKSPDYAAEASMRCDSAAFMTFLAERAGRTCHDGDAAAELLRQCLGIASRKDLNTDPAAAARWRALRADFEAWRTHG